MFPSNFPDNAPTMEQPKVIPKIPCVWCGTPWLVLQVPKQVFHLVDTGTMKIVLVVLQDEYLYVYTCL